MQSTQSSAHWPSALWSTCGWSASVSASRSAFARFASAAARSAHPAASNESAVVLSSAFGGLSLLDGASDALVCFSLSPSATPPSPSLAVPPLPKAGSSSGAGEALASRRWRIEVRRPSWIS